MTGFFPSDNIIPVCILIKHPGLKAGIIMKKSQTKSPPALNQKDIQSIMESALLAMADTPLRVTDFIKLFSVENISKSQIQDALKSLQNCYMQKERGVELVNVANGYQLRTKEENKSYIQRLIQGRPFRLSRPALEVLSVIAYHQPCTKMEIDHIRKLESGHLIKTLLEKELIDFGPKSSTPGRPQTYKTSKLFLETFSLNSLNDLPDLEDTKELLKEWLNSSSTQELIKEAAPPTPLEDISPPSYQNLKEEKKINFELDKVTAQINALNPKVSWDTTT